MQSEFDVSSAFKLALYFSRVPLREVPLKYLELISPAPNEAPYWGNLAGFWYKKDV